MNEAAAERDKPTRSELFELYKIAIEEYRFQVNLNWNRSQYYLALNIAITSVATGILQASHGTQDLTAGIYFAGFVCCLFSIAATNVQQGYYHATRDHKAEIEEQLGLCVLALMTTPGMGSPIQRIARVTTFISVILSVLAATDLAGFAFVLS